MRKKIFICMALLVAICSYSQTKFDSGYFINNNGKKTICLIKNKDWKSNPTSFDYKLTDIAKQQTEEISNVMEFCVDGKIKFVRYTVEIDRSSNNIADMDNNRHPVFAEEVLFLKLLVEGQASLYVYNEKGMVRYFYKTDTALVEQLVYKKYLESNGQVSENYLYRLQLLENLKCENISFNSIQAVQYKQRDLIGLFIRYNKCIDSGIISFDQKEKKDLFNLNIRPGIKNSSLIITNDNVYFKDVDFGNKAGYRIGLEAEFIMPFNNNKWSFFLEPAYQSFKSTVSKVAINTNSQEILASADYKSVEFTLGFRYYLYLSDNSKLFFNAGLFYNINTNSHLTINRDDGAQLYDFEVGEKILKSSLGVGFKYGDRYKVEIRYQDSQDILRSYQLWRSYYNTLSIVFGLSVH